MGRLILTRPAEAGIGEIDWLGTNLENAEIGYAFSGKSAVAQTTLNYLSQFHNTNMKKAAVSTLDEVADGVATGANVEEAFQRITVFHESAVRDRLRRGGTVLAVVGHNVLRAYICKVEKMPLGDAVDIPTGKPAIRTYDLTQTGKIISSNLLEIPKRS